MSFSFPAKKKSLAVEHTPRKKKPQKTWAWTSTVSIVVVLLDDVQFSSFSSCRPRGVVGLPPPLPLVHCCHSQGLLMTNLLKRATKMPAPMGSKTVGIYLSFLSSPVLPLQLRRR